MKKLIYAVVCALTLSGIANAGDFFDSTLSLQGKTLDLGEAGRTEDYSVFVTNGSFSASASFVDGNLGVNGGPITLNNNSIVSGTATLSTGSSFNVSGGSSITGARQQSSSFNTKLTNGTS